MVCRPCPRAAASRSMRGARAANSRSRCATTARVLPAAAAAAWAWPTRGRAWPPCSAPARRWSWRRHSRAAWWRGCACRREYRHERRAAGTAARPRRGAGPCAGGLALAARARAGLVRPDRPALRPHRPERPAGDPARLAPAPAGAAPSAGAPAEQPAGAADLAACRAQRCPEPAPQSAPGHGHPAGGRRLHGADVRADPPAALADDLRPHARRQGPAARSRLALGRSAGRHPGRADAGGPGRGDDGAAPAPAPQRSRGAEPAGRTEPAAPPRHGRAPGHLAGPGRAAAAVRRPGRHRAGLRREPGRGLRPHGPADTSSARGPAAPARLGHHHPGSRSRAAGQLSGRAAGPAPDAHALRAVLARCPARCQPAAHAAAAPAAACPALGATAARPLLPAGRGHGPGRAAHRTRL
eukprot:Opistho-1_new@103797